ncbi:hypothetical protein GCM10022215_18340 [Nocardioides fonticola]|uniref:Uncharacterized protein n=1 Tax=Nocardioides fonticola TaxID=450363 RepID=A0ABP7XIQ1_9ACTN
MTGRSEEEVRLAAQVGAHVSWANTPDRSARTAPARAALARKFLDEAGGDPDRAEQLRKAHFANLALKSVQARRKLREASAVLDAELSDPVLNIGPRGAGGNGGATVIGFPAVAVAAGGGGGGGTTVLAPASAPEPYHLFVGRSLDGATEYAVHVWPDQGTAQLDERPAGSGDTWRPTARLAVEEV